MSVIQAQDSNINVAVVISGRWVGVMLRVTHEFFSHDFHMCVCVVLLQGTVLVVSLKASIASGSSLRRGFRRMADFPDSTFTYL